MTPPRLLIARLVALSSLCLLPATLLAADAPKPIKALLVTGGCCHDYTTQKNLIKEGLEARAHIEVTVVQQGGSTTDTKIPLYQDPNWADGYDIVLHDECFAGVKDPAWTERVLKPHQKGLPGVVIHCAMHCYRDGTDQWFRFCGVTSHKHGAHYPHTVYNYDAQHPIMADFGPAWYNPQGELYHIAKVWDTAHVLGASKEKNEGTEQPCVWTNQYGDARIFGTTLGHHNETVEDDKFLSLLTRGTLWACDKLNDDYLKPSSASGGPQMVPVNLALGKPAKASSEETGKSNFAKLAFDGNKATRWCANGGNYPQWVEVDLGEPKELRGAQIDWESANSVYRFTLDGSADGKSWKTIVDQSENNGTDYDFEFVAGGFRYIRLNVLACQQGGWASVRELRLLGKEMVKVDPIATKDEEDAQKLAEVKIPDGFEKTYFAGPPAVNYPVFVAASPEGDVYVSVDKNGSLDRELKRGAIHRLRDTNGDGKADEVKLFVPDVDSPRGLVWDRDRLYVLHPPHLSAFIDEDGDGRSDKQEILIKNLAFTFKDRPADHTSNGVTLGIDGWLYLAIGDFGFMEAEGADGRKLQMRGGGVLRVRPDGSNMEVYSNGTRNILEVAIDPLMNGFTRDNTNDGGGWDIRLHHFSGLEDHGYPRLYMNFGEEIIQPLADYGGGSGCGALYLAEPGFPEGFGNALYTADWGRSWIYRHNPKRKGATFEANQEEFLGIPRVTDLDVDADSHIYAASWKGATFTYNGEDVGYVVRVSPKGYQAQPMPNLKEADTNTLLKLLQSDSHRRRLAAQRELLARGLDDATVAKIQEWDIQDPNVMVAVVYLLTQAKGTEDPMKVLAFGQSNELANNPDVRANAMRALADMITLNPDNKAAAEFFASRIDSMFGSDNPRRQLEAIIAVARVGNQEFASLVLPSLDSEDPVIRHTAYRALAKLEAAEALFTVIDDDQASPQQRQFALFALERIHQAEVVDGLIERLKSATSPDQRQGLLVALSRLYNIDGTWKGNSWGTRPDTRGPYYQPEKWAQSDKIGAVLKSTLASAASEESAFLLNELRRNRVELDGTLQMALDKAKNDPAFAAGAISLVAQSNELPSEAIELLTKAATAEGTDPAVRAQAITALLRSTEKDVIVAALTGLAKLHQADGKSGEFKSAVSAFQNKNQLSRQIGILDSLAKAPSSPVAVWGEAGLLTLSGQDKLSPEVASTVKGSLDAGWNDPARQVQLLEAAMIVNDRKLDEKVVGLLSSSNADVAAAAGKVADAWKLKRQMTKPAGPKVGTIDPEEVIKLVVGTKGDASRGESLFAKLTCNKCHTVDPNETPRGPYLPQVAKTYKRDQLTESIVLPSKSLAQGFVTNIFQMDDGRLLSGFITFEGPEKIVIRDNQGNEITLDPDAIEGQKKDNVSIMPIGLANDVTVQELADLVTYLESLASKAGTK
ncbi:discoidin domain-containing protein [Blastopirellula marina]|uniref:Heme-binding protein n=1 Tax=Blastopirellula marina TaxID=124 RepID=A0A2S8FLM1_9BACT|nr:discoidin domain-containing protein [Blastopirellula marina]PQO33063.1 heme-binding protein [Blastopirellula marina]PTL43230.1 heme-binding protein [Blastopirellula marina]